MAKGTCTIPDCGKPKFCRGWCSAHYSRWQRHGDPLAQLRQSPRSPEDFDKPKLCTRCGIVKQPEEFGRSKNRPDGKARYCYGCNAAAVRAHNESAGEARRLARQGYSLARRTKLYGNRLKVTAADLKRIVTRFGGLCAYCPAPWAQFDHVVPLSRGGRHSIGNIVPACLRCNTSKSDSFLMEWRLARGGPSKRNKRPASTGGNLCPPSFTVTLSPSGSQGPPSPSR